MDMLEVFLIVIFGVPIISLLVFALIAADVMQWQEEQGRAQISVRRNRALDAGTPCAAQEKQHAGASDSGVSENERQKIQAVRRL